MSHIVRDLYGRFVTMVDPALKLELMRRFAYNRSSVSVLMWSVLQQHALRQWEAGGQVDPPPAALKHRVIRNYAARFGIDVLVETGTFLGDTVYVLRKEFARIISIELDPQLATAAQRRFARNSNVTVLAGDSSCLLPDVLRNLDMPVLFWLDAHWSGG